MFELSQLKQIIAIYEYGTISKAADHLHISQPALSRSMQRLEDALDISLFHRQRNKINFNENGELVVAYAKKIVNESNSMVSQIQALIKSQYVISIGSCAPAPLWEIVPILKRLYPEMLIQEELKDKNDLLDDLKNDVFQIIITIQPIDDPDVICYQYIDEHLHVSLPPNHKLASNKEVYFKDINGENFLLFSKIGFWHEIHKRNMPDSHFLMQEERMAFREINRASTLPSFTSDLVIKNEGYVPNRVIIPIFDQDASITYYCCFKRKDQRRLFMFEKELKDILKRRNI